MKILVVRFSSIGDIILTSPVVKALKEQLHGAEIHFLTKAKFSELVRYDPSIDRLHIIAKEIDEVRNELLAEKFDVIIDLHNNLRTHRLSSMLKVKTYRFPKLNFKKWLLVRFKMNKMPDLHVVDRYFMAVEKLGVRNNVKSLLYFPNPEEDDLSNLELPERYVSIAIGAQFATKRMPNELLKQIIERLSLPVVLVGGKEDEERAQELAEGDWVIDLCGRLTIAGSAAVVNRSACLLTNDTGMMHIASSGNVPIVSVWGNTVPELGMYPYRPENPDTFSMHEVEGLACRPCSKIGYQQCPKRHFNCMKQQNVDEIVEQITRFLQKTTSSAQ